MFADYILRVTMDYQDKKAGNLLPLSLIRPSPAKLRDTCLTVCNKGLERRDERVLTAFFGQGSDKAACIKAISGCDIDDFKPLANFLTGRTTSTGDNNIELLAWLIDFPGRPYDDRKDYTSDCSNNAGEPKTESGVDTIRERPVVTKRRKAVIPLAMIVLASFGSIWLVSKGCNTSPSGVCMLWTGDHYQPISCNQKSGDALIIPLDSEKMDHFRKITRPDTITENALGSIWYANFHGVYECYTSSGFHPIEASLKLKLLTDYVLLKHIHPGLHADPATPPR